jgi:xylan 1,4-beta-xylosidase
VRFGLRADRLTHNHQVYDGVALELNSLNAGVPYVFTVDAVNESGVTPGQIRTVVN